MNKIILTVFSVIICSILFSQNDTIYTQDATTYRIIKTDGGELIGKIISQDAREILLLTKDNRQIYLPQHMIKKMVTLKDSDFNHKGDFVGEDMFATRYFITTNGLPIKKGEHYIQWNLFGPDFQFGVGENLGVGIMTTWVGMPIIGTIKKSWQLREKIHFALGGLIGTGSWATPDFGGTLPFCAISFGDRKANIAISGGYGAVWENGNVGGRAITSVAGMAKVSSKISLIFDSFILLPTQGKTITNNGYSYSTGKSGVGIIIPGIRWHQDEGKAFQLGFVGILTNSELIPIGIPMLQWYRTL